MPKVGGGRSKQKKVERKYKATKRKMVANDSRTVTRVPRECISKKVLGSAILVYALYAHTRPHSFLNNTHRHQTLTNQPSSQTKEITITLHPPSTTIVAQKNTNMSIHTAALEGQFGLVKQLLEQDKAALTSKDEDERQPLHWAGK